MTRKRRYTISAQQKSFGGYSCVLFKPIWTISISASTVTNQRISFRSSCGLAKKTNIDRRKLVSAKNVFIWDMESKENRRENIFV